MAEGKKWDGDGVPLEDSNCAGIGTDEDKALRKSAASTEPAWAKAGQEEGIEVWRIENFKVVPWPKEWYGKFYKGDSYIVLVTHKVEDVLSHSIFFWLGENTSIDEMGTAAYKTVELDDFFDGEPTEHREVMGNESEQFVKLFKCMEYLEGGIDSAFTHTTPDTFQAKLLHVRRLKSGAIRVMEVPREREQLNNGDCFVLDAGTTIYSWYGSEASPFEKAAANNAAENIENRRAGKAKATTDVDAKFWELLGGEGPVKGKQEVTDEVGEMDFGEGVMYCLSNASGELLCKEVGRGDLKKEMLCSDDVMMVDAEKEVYLWVGKGAALAEKRNAFRTAMGYLKANGKSLKTPIHMFKEGSKISNSHWNKIFAN